MALLVLLLSGRIPCFFPVQSIVLAGIYSSIPYMLLALLVPLSGLIADVLRAKVLSTGTVRKIMTTIGMRNNNHKSQVA